MWMGKWLWIFVCAVVFAAMGCQSANSRSRAARIADEAVRKGLIDPNQAWKLTRMEPEPWEPDPRREYIWKLETRIGDKEGVIRVRLWPDVAPANVRNIRYFTNTHFYDDLVFGKVVPGSIAEGGGPLKDGSGEPGYRYKSDITKDVKHDRPYLVGSVNHDKNVYGSQFYLTFKPAPELDGKYAIFGEVIDGKEVVDAIEAAGSADGRPEKTIKIVRASMEDKILPIDDDDSTDTKPPPAKVPAPKNVTATSNDVDKVVIRWDAVSKATEYRVIRSSVLYGSEEETGNASQWQRATSYTDRNARPGLQYHYQVQARSEAGMSGMSNSVDGHRPVPQGRAERLPFEVY